jgi:UrcA family protein
MYIGINKTHLLAGLALATGIAGVTHAESSIVVTNGTFHAVRTEAVRMGDLNLSNATARKTLDHRISAAVERVCDKSPTWGVKRPPADYRRCATRASADALAQTGQALARSGATNRAIAR